MADEMEMSERRLTIAIAGGIIGMMDSIMREDSFRAEAPLPPEIDPSDKEAFYNGIIFAFDAVMDILVGMGGMEDLDDHSLDEMLRSLAGRSR